MDSKDEVSWGKSHCKITVLYNMEQLRGLHSLISTEEHKRLRGRHITAEPTQPGWRLMKTESLCARPTYWYSAGLSLFFRTSLVAGRECSCLFSRYVLILEKCTDSNQSSSMVHGQRTISKYRQSCHHRVKMSYRTVPFTYWQKMNSVIIYFFFEISHNIGKLEILLIRQDSGLLYRMTSVF